MPVWRVRGGSGGDAINRALFQGVAASSGRWSFLPPVWALAGGATCAWLVPSPRQPYRNHSVRFGKGRGAPVIVSGCQSSFR